MGCTFWRRASSLAAAPIYLNVGLYMDIFKCNQLCLYTNGLWRFQAPRIYYMSMYLHANIYTRVCMYVRTHAVFIYYGDADKGS